MPRQIGDGDRTDFDETRRLMYMALVRQRTEKYELAGTIINALVHHHRVEEDAPTVVEHILNVIEGLDGYQESRNWMQAQIDRISDQLGD